MDFSIMSWNTTGVKKYWWRFKLL